MLKKVPELTASSMDCPFSNFNNIELNMALKMLTTQVYDKMVDIMLCYSCAPLPQKKSSYPLFWCFEEQEMSLCAMDFIGDEGIAGHTRDILGKFHGCSGHVWYEYLS